MAHAAGFRGPAWRIALYQLLQLLRIFLRTSDGHYQVSTIADVDFMRSFANLGNSRV